MIKGMLISIWIVVMSVHASGQTRFNIYGTYTFQDHIESYYSTDIYFDGSIDDGILWGFGAEYFLKPNYSLELSFQRENTHAPITFQVDPYYQTDFEDFKFDLNYILVSGNRYTIKSDGKVEGYGTIMAGICIVDIESPSTKASDTVTKFSWGAKLGCNVWATEKVGFKFQVQLLSVVQGAGGGAFFGTSGGGVGVSTYSSIYQFGLGAGLSLKVGQATGRIRA